MTRLFLALAIVLACSGASCSDAAKEVARTGGSMLVDCTTAETAATITELAPVFDKMIVDAIDPNGAVDYTRLKDVGKGFTKKVGGCLLATAIAKLTNPKPDDPDAPKSAGVHVDVAATRAGFTKLKDELFEGATFQTSAGQL